MPRAAAPPAVEVSAWRARREGTVRDATRPWASCNCFVPVSVPPSSGQRSRQNAFAGRRAVIQFQSPLLRGNVRDRWLTGSYFSTFTACTAIAFRKTGRLLLEVIGLRKRNQVCPKGNFFAAQSAKKPMRSHSSNSVACALLLIPSTESQTGRYPKQRVFRRAQILLGAEAVCTR